MIPDSMKKLMLFVAISALIVGCEKSQDKKNSESIARIVGFDLNCSTCILEFPDDSLKVKDEIGQSPGNYYQAINLSNDNYEIGQKIKIKFRKAETNEVSVCRTMYPTYSYRAVFITDIETFNNITFNDTIDLSYRDCLYDPENHMYICLDSVLNDSRCPIGAYCFWEGNAEVRFRFEKFRDKNILFNLNTNIRFLRDTIVDGYKITLVGLRPAPALQHRVAQSDYKAKIVVIKTN